ncbi:MAG: proton-conducting transporter membrane subunit [Caldilineaceae bacterium]
MSVGNLMALRQNSVKRMLAYSSVAQAGYMLMGLVSVVSVSHAELSQIDLTH